MESDKKITKSLQQIVFWGTYDTGKPRVRILLRGLRENGIKVIECHESVWQEIEDKSQIFNWITRLLIFIRWILCYPKLILRYIRLPKHDAVVVSYLGHIDVIILWPFAKLRGVPIIWDAFLSLYNTVVEDRKLIGPQNPLSFILYAWEWLACRAADKVILDTQAHANYFVNRYKLNRKKTGVVFVGAEPEFFYSKEPERNREEDITVLFYGQFIPLHGIETIVQAAQKMRNDPVKWVIIGQGQETTKFLKMINKIHLPKLQWIPWVEYRELVKWIYKSDICLGIFGKSEKAGMVIPNKVFQILLSGKPLITRDSPAIRELIRPDMPGVFLIPPGDSTALVEALREYLNKRLFLRRQIFHKNISNQIQPHNIGWMLMKIIDKVIKGTK